jgi:hypothetical protein
MEGIKIRAAKQALIGIDEAKAVCDPVGQGFA